MGRGKGRRRSDVCRSQGLKREGKKQSVYLGLKKKRKGGKAAEDFIS